MALGQVSLTLGAGATQVKTGHTACRQVIIGPTTHAIYIGTSAVTSTVYGSTVGIAAATTVPCVIGPYDSGGINLEEIYITGTQNDVVPILYNTI